MSNYKYIIRFIDDVQVNGILSEEKMQGVRYDLLINKMQGHAEIVDNEKSIDVSLSHVLYVSWEKEKDNK